MAEYTHPTAIQQLDLTIKNAINNTNICKACVVVAVNQTSPLTVNVQPVDTLKIVEDGKNATYTNMPILKNIPVIQFHSQSSGFGCTIPVSVGDTGYLVFADRALGNFKKYGKETPPQQDGAVTNAIRSHSLTDAIFIAGLCHNSNGYGAYDNDCVVLRDKERLHSVAVYADKVVVKSTDASIITATDNDITVDHNGASVVCNDTSVTISKGGCSVVITDGGIAITATGPVTMKSSGGASMGMDGNTITLDGDLNVNGNITNTGNVTTSGNVSATGTVHGSNI